MRLVLKERGVRHASELFAGMGRRSVDAKPVWRKLARLLMATQRQRFQRQPWVPLDEDTVRQKKNARILHLEGALEEALTVWRAPGQKLRISRQSLVFGLQPQGVAYHGKFHHYGEGVPKRSVLELPPFFEQRASDALLDHLLNRRR